MTETQSTAPKYGEAAIKSLNFWDELGHAEGWEYLEDGTRVMLGTAGAPA